MASPTGYAASYGETGKQIFKPVVTWNERGQALVFNTDGQLVVASEQPGFRCVFADLG